LYHKLQRLYTFLFTFKLNVKLYQVPAFCGKATVRTLKSVNVQLEKLVEHIPD